MATNSRTEDAIYLVEIDAYNIADAAIETLRYSSDFYRTASGDTPASTLYEPRVKNPGTFSRYMFGRGRSPIGGNTRPAVTFGGVELYPRIGDALDENLSDNTNDDSIIRDYSFAGREIRIKLVERGAALSTAETICTGTIRALEVSESAYVFRVSDRLPDLTAPINPGRLLGTNSGVNGIEGSSGEEGVVKPCLWGTAKNCRPALLNSSTLIYGLNFMPDGISLAQPANGTAHGDSVDTTAGRRYNVDTARVSDAYFLTAHCATDTNLGVVLELYSISGTTITSTGVTLRLSSGVAREGVIIKALGNDRFGVLTMETTGTDGVDFYLVSVDTASSPETMTQEATLAVHATGTYSDADFLGDFDVVKPIATGASPGDGYVAVVYRDASTNDLVLTRIDVTNTTASVPTGYPLTVDSVSNYVSVTCATFVEDDGVNNGVVMCGGSSGDSGGDTFFNLVDTTSGVVDGFAPYPSAIVSQLDGVRLISMQDPANQTESDSYWEMLYIGSDVIDSDKTKLVYMSFDPASPTNPVVEKEIDLGAALATRERYELRRNSEGEILFMYSGPASTTGGRPHVGSVVSNGLMARFGGLMEISDADTDTGAFELLSAGSSPVLIGYSDVDVMAIQGTRDAVPAKLAAISDVYDKGLALSTPTTVDYPDLAQLQGATVASGDYVTCLNLGLIRLGASPDGDVTADAQHPGSSNDTKFHAVAYTILRCPCLFRDSDYSPIRFDKATHIESGEFEGAATDIYGATAGNRPNVGIYADSERSILDVVTEIVSGSLCGIVWDRDGTLQLRAMDTDGSAIFGVDENEILENTLVRATSADEGNGVPVWKVNVGYDKNNFVQRSGELAATVPEDSDATSHGRTFLNARHRFVEATDEATKTKHKTAREITVLTPITERTKAETLAGLILALYKNEIGVFRMSFTRKEAEQFDLGKLVPIDSFRFFGTPGETEKLFVTGLEYDFGRDTITVEGFNVTP